MKNSLLAVLVTVALLAASATLSAEEIKVGGGGASIVTVFKSIEVPFEKVSGITLITLQSTPKNGLIDLVKGAVDIATAAVPLEGMIKGAEKDGVKVDPALLHQVVVAQNRTVLLVHPANPVRALSKEQIKGIFTGKIGNWKEVGGNDAPILVAWGKLSPGQNAQLTKEILDGEPVTKDILETTDYFGIKETIAATPEAVGIDPLALGANDATVRVIRPEPPLVSDIIVVTKGKPSKKVEKLLNFIAEQGSKYLPK